MPPSFGKQKSIAQAEPHETNRSMIDRRKACGWRACPRAEKNERSVSSYFRIWPFPDLLRVPLSTIDQSSTLIGETAADLLVECIEAKKPLPARRTLITPRLIVRESSRRKS